MEYSDLIEFSPQFPGCFQITQYAKTGFGMNKVRASSSHGEMDEFKLCQTLLKAAVQFDVFKFW